MAERGAALVLPDAELTPGTMRAETDELLERRTEMAAAARALARPNAARDVADELLQAAGVSSGRDRTTSSASVL
jgi:UDP-N-acetylglucosamine--N-acetylmuramyl-(pentapeptide) pyrophosphoryl-undecaprenol N-acetylglucosamine transferase